VSKHGGGTIDVKALAEWKETLKVMVTEKITSTFEKKKNEKKEKSAKKSDNDKTENKKNDDSSDDDEGDPEEEKDRIQDDLILCPYRCWLEYSRQSINMDYRKKDNCPDLLFVTKKNDTEMRKLLVEEIEGMVKSVLREANVPEIQWKEVMEERAVEFQYDNIRLARRGNTVCARYNKAEAFKWFLEHKKIKPKRLIFVDDNSDNVYSMFMHWSKKLLPPEPTTTTTTTTTTATTVTTTEDSGTTTEDYTPHVYSVWYPPPIKAEKAQFWALDFIKQFSTTYKMNWNG